MKPRMLKGEKEQIVSMIKLNIMKELKMGNPLWIREIHRRILKRKIDVSVVKISKLVKELEQEGEVNLQKIGQTITVTLKN